MEKTNQQPKDLVSYLVYVFDLGKVNWAFQMKLAKTILSKYSFGEIKYAIDYYKSRGEDIYSLGFLTHKNNMKDPLSMYTAEKNAQESDDSGKRNWARIEQNRKTVGGEDSAEHLFTAS